MPLIYTTRLGPVERAKNDLALRIRRGVFDVFMRECAPGPEFRVADFGVTGHSDHPAHYFFETLYPYRERLTATGQAAEDARWYPEHFPGVTFLEADLRQIPVPDDYFDAGICNAVVEHAGTREQQAALVREVCRVCRAVLFTTPNKRFPIELHTFLPFVHWLPDPLFRTILSQLGFTTLARVENLNPLDRQSFLDLFPPERENRVFTVGLGPLATNLVCISRSTAEPSANGRPAGRCRVREENLLDRYPRTKRNIAQREAGVPFQRDIARKFGREYFDGDRTQGYGGYRYDGRWIPIAERFRDFYGLKAGDRILDVGCAKGFLLHDFLKVVPGAYIAGLDISEYAACNAMETVRGRIVIGTAAALPFQDNSWDLVIAINTVHNLPREHCLQAVREIERVSRRHKYVQVDSWFNEEQRENFERWILTALTYYDPEGWRQLFADAGYTGDYYWTITE